MDLRVPAAFQEPVNSRDSPVTGPEDLGGSDDGPQPVAASARANITASGFIGWLELDHVVNNRPEVGEVLDIPAILVDECITQAQRQTLQTTLGWGPL